MTLKSYKKKRNFTESPEPEGIKSDSSNALHFCVQKHDARNLHYDFRLEYKGILLSWAVPKGPSLNPDDKRLAIMVEDHPLDYRFFEGVIPKGNYGAGTVELWDQGVYTLPGIDSVKIIEKKIEIGLKKGHLTVVLHGEKLQGTFSLQRLKSDEKGRSWLLIKKKEIEDRPELPSKISPMPQEISPMLATLIEAPFNSKEWLFEVKWDGYRAIAFLDEGKARLESRTRQQWNKKFPSIVERLKNMKGQAIFDGELVVLDDNGKSRFQLLQNYQKTGKGNLYYYVFDLLYKDGKDLRNLPLLQRKKILEKVLSEYHDPMIRFSDHVIEEGENLFEEARKNGLEGIIGKNILGRYESKRSRDWVKIKTCLRQEVVIGGFTAPKGSRQKFGALLTGVYDEEKRLRYVGHVGGGFDSALLTQVYDLLKPLVRKKCPFSEVPEANAPVSWIKPELICEVSFAEWTSDNRMRQPIFRGLRTDKNPITVKKEIPETIPIEIEKKLKTKYKIGNLSLTHLDKIYWKNEQITKGDVLDYYATIAPFILPYLKGRPVMLHRFPNGIDGKDFYQKNIDFSIPADLTLYPVKHEGTTDLYLGINDLRSLLYAVNLGSIDLHPFLSRYDSLKSPDYCVIDLDPHDISFREVIKTALTAHEILEDARIPHYCKTSGGKGLHIMIPLEAKYDFTQSKRLAEIICLKIHRKLSAITSMERDPRKRPGKIYLDYLQNRFGQTLAAPYAVRPRPGALVSTPLSWSEINDALDLVAFTIKTVPGRVKETGDLLKPVLGKGINLENGLKYLGYATEK